MKNTIRTFVTIVLTIAIALGVCNVSMAETPTSGDLLHFVPTVMTVRYDEVEVEGYFVNLNNGSVKNFTNFDLDVYDGGKLLLTGDFGDINRFTVPAKGTRYQSFTFNGSNGLSTGTYVCDDSYYTTFSCNFTYVN